MMMTPASFTEQVYLCVAISVVVVLYVSLVALESQWTNHGCAWLQQDCSFPVLTESVLTLVSNPEAEGLNPGREVGKLWFGFESLALR